MAANQTQRRRRLLESHARILGSDLQKPSAPMLDESPNNPLLLSSQPFQALEPFSAPIQESFPFEVAESCVTETIGSLPGYSQDDVWSMFLNQQVQQCLRHEMPTGLCDLIVNLHSKRQDPYRLRLCLVSAESGVVSPAVQSFIEAHQRRSKLPSR